MNHKLITGFLTTLILLFVSCAEDSDDKSLDKTGRLTVRLSDAPFPYDDVAEANVTVFKVEIRKASNEDDTETDTDSMEDGGSPFITLMEEEMEVNLLTLINGITLELADLEIPVGSYDLVRIYVKGVNLVLADDQGELTDEEKVFDFKVPSGENTGIKVFIDPPLQVAGGLSEDLLLDFDVSESFVARGNIDGPDFNGFIFKPVIKASNASTNGTLMGKVTEIIEEVETGIEGVTVTLLGGEEQSGTFTDADGNYSLSAPAGDHQVLVEKAGYLAAEPVDVTLVAGNKTQQDFVLEAEETTDGN